MSDSFLEIASMEKKEQPLAYRNLARGGNCEAAIKYASLVWGDKYKGEVSGNKVPDAEKKSARQEALDFLITASNIGSLECSLYGIPAAFKGVFGAQNKVLCKINHKSAILLISNALTHPLCAEENARLLLIKAMSMKMKGEQAKDVVLVLKEAAKFDGCVYASRAKAHLGIYAYDSKEFDTAIPLLKEFESISTATILMLIYKNHCKDTETAKFYHDKIRFLCTQKNDKSHDL